MVNNMTLSDQQILDIVNALLKYEALMPDEYKRCLREGSAGAASLPAMKPIVDRYLAMVDPPRTCLVEHDHWEGKMFCGNPLPCPRHGGR